MNDLLKMEVRRRLMGEGVPRIEKCLSLLTTEEIWHRPNPHCNSVGNLVLHLCGNVRQWVVCGLGGREDKRDRDAEFNEKGPLPIAILLEKLYGVMAEVDAVLDGLADDQINQPLQVQGFEETGLSVLVHVVEHFSYHVGQITYYTKLVKNVDTAYYGDVDLNNHRTGRQI